MHKQVREDADVLVEDEERLKNLSLVLVGDRASDAVVQLLVCEWLLGLQALIRERGPEGASVG